MNVCRQIVTQKQSITAPTKYANENGVSKYTFTEETYNSSWTDDVTVKYKDLYTEDVIGSSCSFWWLRSPEINDFGKAFVSPGGVVGWLGNSANSDFVGVRPALYIQY